MNLARNQAIQDFHMDLNQESCQVSMILVSVKSLNRFLAKSCQIFLIEIKYMYMYIYHHGHTLDTVVWPDCIWLVVEPTIQEIQVEMTGSHRLQKNKQQILEMY